MSIEKNILSKYDNQASAINKLKDIVVDIIKKNSDVIVSKEYIDIKDKTAILNISSALKSVIFETKTAIEEDLRESRITITQIQ